MSKESIGHIKMIDGVRYRYAWDALDGFHWEFVEPEDNRRSEKRLDGLGKCSVCSICIPCQKSYGNWGNHEVPEHVCKWRANQLAINRTLNPKNTEVIEVIDVESIDARIKGLFED